MIDSLHRERHGSSGEDGEDGEDGEETRRSPYAYMSSVNYIYAGFTTAEYLKPS